MKDVGVPGDPWAEIPDGSALRRVVRELEHAEELSSAVLAAALRGPVGIEDVAPWIRFDADNYRRNLVAAGGRWELRLHCWRPGQTTSLHGHGGAACAFRVVRGSAVETRIGARDAVLPPGAVVEESAEGFVHQVGNAGEDALLTLHAYAPALPVGAPSARTGRNVVVVGGGAGGIAVAVHLLRRNDPALR
ncbi:MAG TPA: cysteine dioxygenase family protein, partial [Polyangiaceae bacterium]